MFLSIGAFVSSFFSSQTDLLSFLTVLARLQRKTMQATTNWYTKLVTRTTDWGNAEKNRQPNFRLRIDSVNASAILAFLPWLVRANCINAPLVNVASLYCTLHIVCDTYTFIPFSLALYEYARTLIRSCANGRRLFQILFSIQIFRTKSVTLFVLNQIRFLTHASFKRKYPDGNKFK